MILEDFVSSASVLLIVALLMNILFRHIGLGSIAGLLVAGIIVGPHTPGPYITKNVDDVRSFAELGVVLLLFIIGLEMRPSRLWAMRREAFGLGSLQIILTTFALAFYSFLSCANWKTSMVIGMTLALSSTAMVMQMLLDKGEITSPHGSTAFGVLLMQDIAIIPMLAIIPFFAVSWEFSKSIPEWKHLLYTMSIFLIVWGFGKYLIPFALEKLAHQKNREGFLIATMLSVFLSAWAIHTTGFSFALGGFMMGILLSDCQYSLQIEAYIEPYKRILISLFFVAVGMSIDIKLIASYPFFFVQHFVAILIIKIFVMFLLCLFFGMDRSVSINVSFLLAQGGEFGFVLLSSAKVLGVINDTSFVMGVAIISMGMLLTPPIARLGDFIALRISNKKREETPSKLDIDDGTEKRVIIGGYGRVGHIVAVLLYASRVPFIVFDNDRKRVAQGRSDGFPVYFGDITIPDLLFAARPEKALVIVLTVDKEETALQAISHIRSNYPELPIIARARDLEASGRMILAGATLAMPEAVEASLRLATETLKMVGVSAEDVDFLLKDVRRKNYELVAQKNDNVGQ